MVLHQLQLTTVEKAMVEGAAAILRTVWGVWRSGRPYDPTRAPGRGAARPAAA
jgi:hypothetical protein